MLYTILHFTAIAIGAYYCRKHSLKAKAEIEKFNAEKEFRKKS